MALTVEIADPAEARNFLSLFDQKTRRRGEGYVRGAIDRVTVNEAGTAIQARVRGSKSYTVKLACKQGSWGAKCACPVSIYCKHAYAVMKSVLEGLVEVEVKTKKNAATKPLDGLETRLTEALERKLSAEERNYVKSVMLLYKKCDAKGGALTAWELQPFTGRYGSSWERVEPWDSFPRSEILFWYYLETLLRERNANVPAFMEALKKIEPVPKHLTDLRRRKEVQRWRETFQNLSLRGGPARGRRVDIRLVVAPEEPRLEWRSEGAEEFQSMKQAHYKRLAEEYMSGLVEFSPESHLLWNSIFKPWDYRVPRMDYQYTEWLRSLNFLLRMPALSNHIVTAEGRPLVRTEEPLRWQLNEAASEDDDYELRLVLPDGSPAPAFRLVLSGHPTLYLTETAVYPGPPARSETQDACKPARIPAPALETRDGLEFLQRMKVELPSRIRRIIKEVKLGVRIECALRRLYPGSETEAVFIRVVSEHKEHGLHEVFTPSGWSQVWEQSSPKTKRQDSLLVYDRSAQSRFPALFDSLGPSWEGYEGNWRVKLTRNFPEKFVPWLQSIPGDIEVRLDPELATLRDNPVSGSVKLECTEAEIDWFDLQVVLDVSDTQLSQEELKLLLDAKGRFVRLGKKGWRRLEFNIDEEEDQRLARLGLSARDFSSEPQKLHALQLADEAAARLLSEQQAEQIRRRADELKTRVAPEVPAAIRAQLRPYQVEGFHFLAYLSENRFGGILADDMGLGKTVQTLTWLAWLRAREDFKNRPSLVVCPKSVMDNWHAEAGRFLPELRVKQWKGTDGSSLREFLADADLLVLNYAQLRAIGDDLTKIDWHAAILDEGQYIKNPQSQTAVAARALKAGHRLALSGTPIENRLLDLWSLMAFAMPGVLGNRTAFGKRFDQKDDPLARRRLAARVRPFLLRRTKNQVAKDLPDRVEEDLLCEMEGEQKALYRAEFKRAQQMLLSVHTQQELNEQRFHFLTSLLRLRQICCHPGLISEGKRTDESAKVAALLELLEPLMEEGHKVLVFSQFVSMLDILRDAVREKGWNQFYLAGDTENRGDLVREFQAAEGAAVFLISLKAGGFGLNLTAASYVVLFDPWWNPAVESQAIDRTHRIGQVNKVIAYRLLIKNSIEEKIRALQRTKTALAEDVLGEENFAKSLTLDDLKFLFSGDGE